MSRFANWRLAARVARGIRGADSTPTQAASPDQCMIGYWIVIAMLVVAVVAVLLVIGDDR